MFDVIIILSLVIALFWGYKQGAVSAILKMGSKIICIIATLILSPLVITSMKANSGSELGLRSAFALLINVIVFAIVSIIVNIIVKKLKVVNMIPVIGKFNKPIGAGVQCLYTMIKISLLVFVLGYAYESIIGRLPFRNTIITKFIYDVNLVKTVYDLLSYL